MRLLSWFFSIGNVLNVMRLMLFSALIMGAQFSIGMQRDVDIRRTTDGIPHIKAKSWEGLGYGYGFVQAEDALCTLAEAFVTYNGQRSYYWGGEGKPHQRATFGQSSNLELDIFFKSLIDDEMVETYRHHQSAEIQQLVFGFTAGFNHYLASMRTTRHAHHACEGEAWLKPIDVGDVYRRMYAAGLAAGYARFIPQIANAQPPSKQGGRKLTSNILTHHAVLAQRLENRIGDQPDIGSNAIAYGEDVTGETQGALFGNPHWYWGGPDRFYQAHLMIPGKLNVAGVSFLGVPVINIGFNDHVAWSHTVSSARRYGLFELALVDNDPTAYKVDDQVHAMKRKPIDIEVRDAAGDVYTVKHTTYVSEYGPVVNFGPAAPILNWNAKHALVIRDINADNFAMFDHYLRWARAKSLDEFVSIQKETRAVPWVNTIAIGRGDGRAWYGDIGAVPYVTDALRARCAGASAAVFARLDAVAPLLDGSRSDCNWQTDSDAHIGKMPVDRMPSLFSKRYVANMNNSYWLSQPKAPIENIDSIFGGEKHAQSLRTRAGHLLANQVAEQHWSNAGAVIQALQAKVLDARSYAAVHFKDEMLSDVCQKQYVSVQRDILTGKEFVVPQEVDIASACSVMSQWSSGGNANDRGSLVWDAWWRRLRNIPTAEFYQIPFSAKEPLSTPAQPNSQDPRVAEALGAAVLWMQSQGLKIGQPRGSVLAAKVGAHSVGLYGGCGWAGYFTVACNRQGYAMTETSLGNSYLQLVSFDSEGVEAYTLLAHGEDERALLSGKGSAVVKRYADKDWLRMPFTEQDINHDPELRHYTLSSALD